MSGFSIQFLPVFFIDLMDFDPSLALSRHTSIQVNLVTEGHFTPHVYEPLHNHLKGRELII